MRTLVCCASTMDSTLCCWWAICPVPRSSNCWWFPWADPAGELAGLRSPRQPSLVDVGLDQAVAAAVGAA